MVWPHPESHLDNSLLIGYAAQVRLRVGALLHSNSNANTSVTSSELSSLGNSSRAQERAKVIIIIMVGIISKLIMHYKV